MIDAVLRDQCPRLRVYGWSEPAVIIGRGGHQDQELFTAAIEQDRIPVLKRPGGGCSVVLDPGNLIVAVALPLPGIGGITRAFAAISHWLCAALAGCGIPDVRQEGVSDLVLGSRKIGGSCVYRSRGLLYYSTTLLIEPDIGLVQRYLKLPPREPQYRNGRAHQDFMGSLRPDPWPHSPQKLREALEPELQSTLAALQTRCFSIPT